MPGLPPSEQERAWGWSFDAAKMLRPLATTHAIAAMKQSRREPSGMIHRSTNPSWPGERPKPGIGQPEGESNLLQPLQKFRVATSLSRWRLRARWASRGAFPKGKWFACPRASARRKAFQERELGFGVAGSQDSAERAYHLLIGISGQKSGPNPTLFVHIVELTRGLHAGNWGFF